MIALTDEFTSPTGEFLNYDSYQTADRANTATLKHKDIRTMQQANITSTQSVFNLSSLSMQQLEGLAMSVLEGTTIVYSGEAWAGGTVASDPTRGNFRILSMTLAVGTNTATSVVTDRPVDLLTGFSMSDSVSMALPSFPAASITQSTSFIDFTSHPTGNFTTGPTASVALNASTVTLTAANSEFRVPLSSFNQNSINLTAITGVRLRIVATGVATMRVAAIRLLPTAWTQGAIDMDTRYNRIRKSIPRNGDSSQLGFTWPIMWRAQQPTSSDDPRPIDSEFALLFNTGSMVGSNSATLYFRETTEDFLTMLDLNGLMMSDLDGHVVPDVGAARYSGRTMDDLDQFLLSELDSDTVIDLERKPDYTSASWISFNLIWGPTSTQIQMGNTESGNSEASGSYTYSLGALTPNTNYVWFTYLDENRVRSKIYAMSDYGVVGALVYDTTAVIDDGAFRRRKGRFGWFASLQDGDSSIDAINAREVTYAEYRSLPFESNTPVVGAEMFFSGTPNLEHFQSLSPGIYNTSDTTITLDANRTTTTESWRVDNPGIYAIQGVRTNVFPLSDFKDTEIEFDIWFPSDIVDQPIAYLVNGFGRTIPLLMPELLPNQWQRVRINSPYGHTMLSGDYYLTLLQLSSAASTWWVDNITVFTRSIKWAGRSVIDDPWQSNDAPWTPFKNSINREGGGIVFTRRGKQLQIQGKACAQDAHIDRVQFKPQYAQLGRFKPKGITVPNPMSVAGFSYTSIGSNTVRLQSNTPVLTNFVSNPGFETNTAGWATTGPALFMVSGGTISRSLITSSAGVASGLISAASGSMGAAFPMANTFYSSKTYRLSFDIQGLAGGEEVSVIFGSSSGSSYGSIGMFTASPPAWTPKTVIWKPTSDVADGIIMFLLAHGTSANWYIDNVIVSEVPLYSIVDDEWNFGDGTLGIGSATTHTYPAPGAYTVTLVSMDNNGNRSTTSGTVTV